jgi:hypothetical protein
MQREKNRLAQLEQSLQSATTENCAVPLSAKATSTPVGSGSGEIVALVAMIVVVSILCAVLIVALISPKKTRVPPPRVDRSTIAGNPLYNSLTGARK